MSWREFIKMKSIVKNHHGESQIATYSVNENVEIPPLSRHSLLVEVKACALSQLDDKVLHLLYRDSNTTSQLVNQNFFPVGQDIAGVVKEVGTAVTNYRPGDEVVGIIPLDYRVSGCADLVVLHEYDVAHKPSTVSFVDAAGCIGDAVKAYTALHYLGRMTAGDTVLVLNGASAFGSLCIQLAYHWGGKVLTTVSTEDERLYVTAMSDQLARTIDLSSRRVSGSQYVWSCCMDETGGLGVDLVVDCPPQDTVDPNANLHHGPSTHEIISTLAVGGHWVTASHNLQIDPPHSRMLFLKCASLGYLFEQAWTLSSSHQGRYLHILMDIMEKVAHGTIRPNIHHTVPFDSVVEAMSRLSTIRVGKVVMKVD